MHVNLSADVENYLQGKVDAGLYDNMSDAIRDAILHMKEEDARLEAFRAAIQIGDEQITRGEYTLHTPEFLGQSMERAKENSKQGKKVDSDVLP
jgi:antitoxin ParD1/3/4